MSPPMNQISLEPFRGGDALSDYVARYRRVELTALEVGPPLDLFPGEPAPANFTPTVTWEHPWPHGERAGVYLIYSDSCDFLYVGKAQHLGRRLYSYFRSGENCVIQHPGWPQRPRFVINVAVPADMTWEASGLEAYLIQSLQPFCNIVGR